MTTQHSSHVIESENVVPELVELDDYASYEEGDFVVICDRTNAKAWVKSDTTTEIEA